MEHASHRSQEILPRVRAPLALTGLLLIQILLLVWGGVLRFDRMNVRGVDPVFYFIYLRSLAFDQDLDFRNDLAFFSESGNLAAPIQESPTGLAENVFSIGPAILLSPFYAVAHVWAILDERFPADGFSRPYEVSCFLALPVYGFAGILLSYYLLRRFFSEMVSVVSVGAGWLASSLAYYLFPIALMPHSLSFFGVSLFLFLWIRIREQEELQFRDWAVLGAALGLCALIRWQEALFGFVPLVDLAIRKKRFDPGFLKGMLVYSGMALFVFAPQMVAWSVIYGSPLTIPQGGSFLNPLKPELFRLFFSRRNGLITWTPIILPCLVGLIFWVRVKQRISLGLSFVAVVAAQAYLNGIVEDWYAGMGFGARRFVGSLPVFMLGLGAFLEWLSRKIPRWQMVSLPLLLVIWNGLFLVQYYVPLFPRDRAPTWREMILDKMALTASFHALGARQAAARAIRAGNPNEAERMIRYALDAAPHSPEAHLAASAILLMQHPTSRNESFHHFENAYRILGDMAYVRNTFRAELTRFGLDPSIRDALVSEFVNRILSVREVPERKSKSG